MHEIFPAFNSKVKSGAVSDFYSGGCELASEASLNFLAPLEFFDTPLQGGGELAQGGAKEETKYL